MSKVFRLKRWLTLPESAKHLTTVFGEDVTEADILRFALDGQLRLSVVFLSPVLASPCMPVKEEEIVYDEVPSLCGTYTLRLPKGGKVLHDDCGVALQVLERFFVLEEDKAYDLPMMGGERCTVDHTYWSLAGGPRDELIDLDGTFVAEGHRVFQLQGSLQRQKGEQKSFYPLGALPEDAVIVVRTSALLALQKAITDTPVIEEKPLSKREHAGYLRIIGGLLELMQDQRIRRADTTNQARIIDALVSAYGDKDGISVRNLQSKFAEANRALQAD